MKIISLPRGNGKTKRILEWMIDAPDGETRVGVFFSKMAADYARYQAIDRWGQALKSYQFVSSQSDMHRVLGLKNVVFAIDELDRVLAAYLPYPISFATITETP
jgi:hypothetical protein